MVSDETFRSTADYRVPLLHLFAELEDGQGYAKDICRLFQHRYDHLIPQQHRVLLSNGNPAWDGNVRWACANLKGLGFLDNPERGFWRITDEGRHWLKENPDATRIKRTGKQKSQTSPRKASTKAPSTPGITLEMLEQTRKLMPADQFRQVWGVLYDQLLAEKRTRTITEITQMELGRRTRRWLDDVHTFLNGRSASPLSSEVLCDWMHFCYILELHREAAALLAYVREDEVEPNVYRRVKRIAEVSRSKLMG